jgi:hypothetical protein
LFGSILVDFLFRLTLGVAVAMGVTSSREVTSGFFRVHLWVLMGVQTLAALALWSRQAGTPTQVPFAPAQLASALLAAVLSYVGAVLWMYERPTAGKLVIWLVAALAVAGCVLPLGTSTKPIVLQAADRATSSLLLGFVTTAMLLGHWYLNTPTMKLAPLRKLVLLLGAAVLARALVCGGGMWLEYAARAAAENAAAQPAAMQTWLLFLGLRWLAGIFGVLGLSWLTWQTLRIPNTQSATGILYAAVILAFIGELTSQLLSAEARYPL